jgi:hypothetical protein
MLNLVEPSGAEASKDFRTGFARHPTLIETGGQRAKNCQLNLLGMSAKGNLETFTQGNAVN